MDILFEVFLKYYASFITNDDFFRSSVIHLPYNTPVKNVIQLIKANLFDLGVSSDNPFVIWSYNGKELKSILTNCPSLQDFEEEQYTYKERLDFIET